MVYSLLNASALGFDVVRRPAAQRLGGVLLAAITAPPVLLWELAAAHPAAGLSPREQRESLAASALIRGVRAATPQEPVEVGPDTAPRWGAVLQRMAHFTLGRPSELDRLIATELMGPGSAAADVPAHVQRLAADTLADAAVAEWMAGPADPPSTAHTALHQAHSSCQLPTSVDLGPATDQLTDLLTTLPDTSRQWADRRPDTAHTTGPTEWAEAMHEASWAIELSGRTRPAAAAQLLAATGLAGAGLDPTDLASWAWNPVSALVAATVVSDLLPDHVIGTLTGRATRPATSGIGRRT